MMNIQGVSISKSLSVANLIRAQYSSGRISLPVSRNQSLYARFKHIWGFPAAEQGEGFTLSKLRVLDRLIERLNKLQGQNENVFKITELSDEKVNELINTYEKKLHQLAAGKTAPYSPHFSEKGILVNIFA